MNNLIVLVLFMGVVLVSSEEFASGSQLFSESVYNELLVGNDKNILVSPFSAEIILALTQAGAKDATADELRSALYLPSTAEETEAAVKNILPSFQNAEYVLQTASKIYVEDNYLIKNGFKSTATGVYQAEFQNINFAANVDAADEINNWVAEETQNKIQELIKAEDLDESTRVVLINALYFQANWTVPFQTALTKKTIFFTSEESVEIVAMHQESAQFNYAESQDLDAQILELPFQGNEASMVIVLPNKKEGIAVLEKQTKAVLTGPKYTKEFVQVVLPKFKIESTIDFMDILERMDVHKIFDPVEADLSGIAGEKGDLVVTKIAQKTFIDVNEVGVEAAAATVVDGTFSSLPPTATKYFIADHPFMFYVKVHDIVLFEGRVLVPEY